MNELERIAAIGRIFATGASDAVTLGIGDDAAALVLDEPLVVSVDAAVEHVHFERGWLRFEDLGYKATMAALSDLAAMGAAVIGTLGSLVLPDDVTDDDLQAIAHGQAAACREVGGAVIGGNLARGGELAIHTTVLGHATRVMPRSGACVGDLVMVAGDLGLAAAGLAGLRAGGGVPERWASAWRRPHARIRDGLRAVGQANAAIDVSDGLAADVAQLARASGVAVVLDAEALLVEKLGALAEDTLRWVLHGGEDYALVVTSPDRIDGFRIIGACEAGSGVWLNSAGKREEVVAAGWDHFAT